VTWLGSKKLAFIPVARPRIDAIPPDWIDQIQRRLFFDPDQSSSAPMVKGRDVSLRTYIHATSSGRASFDAQVLPIVQVDKVDVDAAELQPQFGQSLRDDGFDAAALVMLGGAGAGTAEPAGFWARFVMAEGVGVWAMELIHVLTGYWDLYRGDVAPEDRWFDNMSCACGSHPSAFTKKSLGWLDASAITTHVGRFEAYNLHSLGLAQPPPADRTSAVHVGGEKGFLMVEARQKVDQFDGRNPSEGVIVYEVVDPDAEPRPEWTRPVINLKTRTALVPGQTYTSRTGVLVQVLGAIPGGYAIRIDDPAQDFVFVSGQLLFYRDQTRDGTGDVSSPSVIGLGGWQQMQHLFSGGDGIIYAVDPNGQLLFYRDQTRDGTGDVSSPSVIGLGGWQQMQHLFSGGDGIIYAVVA
jgi:hypothetical protein